MRYLFTTLFCVISIIAMAGIYRHDRDKARYMALANEPQFACVGRVYYDGKEMGSCILIDRHTILSAAHVFLNKETAGKKYTFEFKGKSYNAALIINHNAYEPGSWDYDIAYIELATAVENIAPAAVCTTYNELHADVTGVGFGFICNAMNPEQNEGTGKFAGENVIDSLGGVVVAGYPSVLYCDFDCPDGNIKGNDCNKMGSPVPRDLEYYVNGGDSGGGLFRKNGDGWQLVGICSGGGMNTDQFFKTSYYGHISKWTRVSCYQSWVDSCRHTVK